jgi:hypothetical protein
VNWHNSRQSCNFGRTHSLTFNTRIEAWFHPPEWSCRERRVLTAQDCSGGGVVRVYDDHPTCQHSRFTWRINESCAMEMWDLMAKGILGELIN